MGDDVLLRQMHPDDSEEVSRLVSDPDVVKQTLTMSSPYTPSEARQWIIDELAGDVRKRVVLAIVERQSGALVGTVSVTVRRRFGRRKGVLGYWVGKPYWGRGFGGEAVGLFLGLCQQHLELSRFEAKVFEDNEASQRVLRKNGFRKVRQSRLFVPERGGWRRVLTYKATLGRN